MFVVKSTITTEYTYNPEHKGAPFTLDGIKYMNAGELKECLYKASLNLAPVKDANGSFDTCDDVPETGESVKSSKATLTTAKLGTTYNEIKANYFKRVHSTAWVWVIIHDEELVTYHMNRTEFAEFMDKFASLQSGVIRFRADSTKMIQWFEDKVRA